MRRHLTTLVGVGAAVAALTAGITPGVEGQVRVQTARSTDAPVSGWIGISFDVLTDRRGRSTEVLITDVSPGSPAEEAGIRPGDRVLVINELQSPRELAALTERLHLAPGDRVHIELERDGRRHRMELHAARRPESVETGTMQFTYGTDSMVETWYQAMDSLRVEIVTGSGQNVRIRKSTPSNGRIRVVTSSDGRGTNGERGSVQAPFEFFVFRGETHDSLREEMIEVNQVLEELDVRLRERQRELSRVARRDRGVRVSADETRVLEDVEFRRLTAARAEASVRSATLESAMAEAARATAGLQYVEPTPGVGSTSAWSPTVERAEFRPLTPYLVGRNRVAGAEVVEVKPEMAPYFGVQGGVLITDVASGTPASMAGLIPGDVITHIDRVVIRSVEGFRFGVSQAQETLPITLVRQGVPVQVLLRR